MLSQFLTDPDDGPVCGVSDMAKSPDKVEDEYSQEEAKARFDAALRGARIAGHKPMKPAAKKKTASLKKKKPAKS